MHGLARDKRLARVQEERLRIREEERLQRLNGAFGAIYYDQYSNMLLGAGFGLLAL